MSAYIGDPNCTSKHCSRVDLLDRDGAVTSQCVDYHCMHCHGSANCMGICATRCPGHQDEERRFDEMVAKLRSSTADVSDNSHTVAE